MTSRTELRPASPAAPRALEGAPLVGQLLLLSLFWSSSYLFMKAFGADFAPLAIAALRGVLGTLFLGIFVVASGRSLLPRDGEWRHWLVLGILQGVLPNALTAYALTQITASLTSMLQAGTPLLVAATAPLLFTDERLTARRIGGLLLGFGGVALLLGPAAVAGSSGTLLGCLAMVATTASYAAGALYVRGATAAEPVRLALGQQIVSGLPILLVVLAISGPSAFAAAPAHVVELIAFGLFSTALPIVLFMHLIRTAGPTRGAMYSYLVPLWTCVLGAFFFGERIGLSELVGGASLLAGVALASVRAKPAATAAAPRAAA